MSVVYPLMAKRGNPFVCSHFWLASSPINILFYAFITHAKEQRSQFSRRSPTEMTQNDLFFFLKSETTFKARIFGPFLRGVPRQITRISNGPGLGYMYKYRQILYSFAIATRINAAELRVLKNLGMGSVTMLIRRTPD